MNTTPRQTPDGWVPVPDPTILTTAQTQQLREEMYRSLASLREVLEARLQAQEEATNRFRDTLSRELSAHVDTVKDLFHEKLRGHVLESTERFAGMGYRFGCNEARLDKFEDTNKEAIAAAFAANQKQSDAAATANEKSIAKSESATKEKIDGLQALLNGSIKDLGGQITTISSRIDRSEGKQTGEQDNTAKWMSAAALIAAILALIANVMLNHPAIQPVSLTAPVTAPLK